MIASYIADKKLQDKTVLATKLSVGALPEMGYTMYHLICRVVQKKGGGGSISLGGPKALDTRAPRGLT